MYTEYRIINDLFERSLSEQNAKNLNDFNLFRLLLLHLTIKLQDNLIAVGFVCFLFRFLIKMSQGQYTHLLCAMGI